MMKANKLVSLLPIIALLAACDTAPSGSAPMSDSGSGDMRAKLAGKTLVNPETTMNLMANGQLTGIEANGDQVAGAWTIKDGQWCRTLTKPTAYAGTSCRKVTIDGDQVTMTRGSGSSITYVMR